MSTSEVYFSLGSNLGDRESNLRRAVSSLEEYFCSSAKVSAFIETEPWGFQSEDKFINCVVRFDIPDAGQDPYLFCRRILTECKSIESSMGRGLRVSYDENGRRVYRSRPIDVDILFYGNETISDTDLTVPHPLIKERDFVMIPLQEVVSNDIIGHFPDIFRAK